LALGTLNFALLRLLGWAGLGPMLAQALLLPMLAACGYFGLRSVVFRGQADASAAEKRV
jgi:hypothetical protein